MPERPENPEVEQLVQYAGRLQDEAEDLRARYEAKREELQNTLLDAWRKGGSATDIADQLGIGRVRVYQLMDKAESRERGDESEESDDE